MFYIYILFFWFLGINSKVRKTLARKTPIWAVWATFSMISEDTYPVWVRIVMNTNRIAGMKIGIKPKKFEGSMRGKQNSEGNQQLIN